MIELSESEKEEITNNALKEALRKKIAKHEQELEIERRKEYERKMLTAWTGKQYFEYIQQRSLAIFKKPLIQDSDNLKTIKLLCTYFANDEYFEKCGFNLKKGLYVYGNIGCGKTYLMKLFKLNQRRSYQIFSTRNICDQYQEIGVSCLQEFSNPVYYIAKSLESFNQTNMGRCFDDLGAESMNRTHWGNRTIPMREILCYIYEKSNPYFFFHVTSNIPPDKLSGIYGERTYSRMKEMFNFINLNGGDRRK